MACHSIKNNYIIIGVLLYLLSVISATAGDAASDVVVGRPGGALCTANSQCYSRVCYMDGYCAPDGPIEGTTSGGSICTVHSDCFSGYCLDDICAPDSTAPNKVAAGGPCTQDDQCFSGYCTQSRCGADSTSVGKLAAGAECLQDTQCFSGVCHCVPGHCESKRCAPDGEMEEQGPAGGHCIDGAQCLSGSCYNHRCSPASLYELGKVADGGLCEEDNQCESGSTCYLQRCTPQEQPQYGPGKRPYGKPLYTGPEVVKKVDSGGFCIKPSDCTTNLCVYGRCVPSGRVKHRLVADGATCDESVLDGQCQSGYCWEHVCTVTYGNRSSIAAAAAGTPCNWDEVCYSGSCTNFICNSDSPSTNPTILPSFPHRHRNQVAAGGVCVEDDDCYSGYCDDGHCGPDGPIKGTLASGALCHSDSQCYSEYCHQNRCIASAGGTQEGKVAAGAPCRSSESCPLGSSCVTSYCRLERLVHGPHVWHRGRPVFASVAVNDTCWHNAQCTAGRCLQKRCTVRWFPKLVISGTGRVEVRNAVVAFVVGLWTIALMW